MEAIVLNIIYQLRGKRLSTSSTLTSIGVDSLGAVMFIRQLSDRLGGLSLEPSIIFSPNMTITNLCSLLMEKNLEKNQIYSSIDIETQFIDNDSISMEIFDDEGLRG